MATPEQVESAYAAWKEYMQKTHRDFAKESEAIAVMIDAATAPLLQEIAALKGELKLEDLPPEPERTKLDEWQACYAALFRQLQGVIAATAPLTEALEKAREAVIGVLGATGNARVVQRGIGGQTIESCLARSTYNGVPCAAIEPLYEAIAEINKALGAE